MENNGPTKYRKGILPETGLGKNGPGKNGPGKNGPEKTVRGIIGLVVESVTRSPATAGTANRSLLFLEHRIPMPELFTELRFSI